MKIIPVIDLKDGLVVLAQRGNRDDYQPISSPLCQSADIYQVIKAFLKIYSFDTLYIADLNAITGQGNNDELLKRVLTDFTEITFWIDRGYQLFKYPSKLPNNYLPVLGSESYQDDNILDIQEYKKNFILSLDFANSCALGTKTLFSNPCYWPDNIIVMTLERVGSYDGPDLQKLHDFSSRYPDKQFIAAGGIRNAEDLVALKTSGIHQALIASALHFGNISSDDISKLQTKKYPA
ncbi:MAG: HisA/HisF-related TIM barrel protein [Methylococcaceae bacterium]|jgi:phosphoribosylformimino-5-aminoimidazole carboxamide ribotide isomerase|nr:HisA/HisF-related TIM barrel protein [Methylococcaceae bacterium]MDZ4155499.1 HisA/HisF-related TIM barrel protein [Methylococcales bacterium]MDP2395223.1 HisA/HisF-related TIM barrel protein [Methylococcaceae bacterium]MDP3020665.1 HisA/HisF-related TIM barrel protein [Methylococcaceae bacterium]MDP3390104.1 HisA/HisF-related TIM barrel protein [Methylococcaceae bacterium]